MSVSVSENVFVCVCLFVHRVVCVVLVCVVLCIVLWVAGHAGKRNAEWTPTSKHIQHVDHAHDFVWQDPATMW